LSLRFWDASAVVPLLLIEPMSGRLAAYLKEMPGMALWCGTRLECLSALSRRRREGALNSAEVGAARKTLADLGREALVVEPLPDVWDRAERLLEVHPLNAADALQLSSALAWCQERPQGRVFICLDGKLREAARREGFRLLPE
jgi:hypothetical protein